LADGIAHGHNVNGFAFADELLNAAPHKAVQFVVVVGRQILTPRPESFEIV
jgi:hypothetical protein